MPGDERYHSLYEVVTWHTIQEEFTIEETWLKHHPRRLPNRLTHCPDPVPRKSRRRYAEPDLLEALCIELVDEQERPVPVTGEVGQTCVPLGTVEVLPAIK